MEIIPYLIIGGGIAGTTAAETIRANDRTKRIAIISDEPYRLYSRIMLSKKNFFLEKLPFDSIWLKPSEWYTQESIELFTGKRVVNLNPTAQTVTTDDGGIFRYEKLLLALGGRPRVYPPLAGLNTEDVFYLRTLDDARAIMKSIKTARHACVIGGGFISFEMCDLLRTAGISVDLILQDGHFWSSFMDETGSKMVEQAFRNGGIAVHTRSSVISAEKSGLQKIMRLADGSRIPFDIAIIGIGLECVQPWLQDAGIGMNRGITANEYLETNAPSVWTAGDCAEFFDPVLNERVMLGNWVNAQFQGRHAGHAMSTGARAPFQLISSYTTSGFGLHIAFVGNLREKETAEKSICFFPEKNSYARFIVRHNRLIGATLINRTEDIGSISKLIASQKEIPNLPRLLSEPSLSIKTLLKNPSQK